MFQSFSYDLKFHNILCVNPKRPQLSLLLMYIWYFYGEVLFN